MDSWLLGALAVVLIGITLWIVWPGRASRTSEGTSESPEASIATMEREGMTHEGTETLPPQGDNFEDQYTSATADLSAGGVAAAVQPEFLSGATVPQDPVIATREQRWPESDSSGEHIGLAERSENFPFSSERFESRPRVRPRMISLAAGVAVSILGAIGGAWLYARWQRERNKPMSRLRRASNAWVSEASDSAWRLYTAARKARR